MIPGFACSFENAINVATAKRRIRKGKLRIQLDCSLKMIDCRVDIFARNSVVDKLAQAMASA